MCSRPPVLSSFRMMQLSNSLVPTGLFQVWKSESLLDVVGKVKGDTAHHWGKMLFEMCNLGTACWYRRWRHLALKTIYWPLLHLLKYITIYSDAPKTPKKKRKKEEPPDVMAGFKCILHLSPPAFFSSLWFHHFMNSILSGQHQSEW